MTNGTAKKLKARMKPGRVYRRQELLSYSNNLTCELQELVEGEEIVRAAPRLYYRPKLSRLGPRPAAVKDLVRAFLNGGDFLLLSFSDYNSLGLGLTQLYNETIVYNRKRTGRVVLDGRKLSFRRPKDFPPKNSKEFLYIDVLNNKQELPEDTTRLESLLLKQVSNLDKKKLLKLARLYGNSRTRKFYETNLQ